MKKILSSLLCLSLIISLAIPASASKLMPGFSSNTGEETMYTDEDTGNTLSIPSDWNISEVKDDAVAKAEFTNTQDPSAVVQYGSADMWNNLSQTMQKKISREEFDNEMYTPEEIAELVDTKEKYVDSVDINDITYFRAEIGKQRFFSFKVTDTYLIRVENGWMYVYAFSGSNSHKQYDTFENIVASATYAAIKVLPEETAPETVPETTAAPTEAEPIEEDIYADAIAAYEDGDYGQAEKLFKSLSGYCDSRKYLRLIRIRDFGGNTGIGCVYNFNKALTDSEKAEIDAAAEDFYFADTKDVLLWNTDVACYYLFGDWVTASGDKQYAYFKLKKDAAGGYMYTRSSNVSNATSDCVSINKGVVRISITSSNTHVFTIRLTDPDTMTLYVYDKTAKVGKKPDSVITFGEIRNFFTMYRQ